ncbi:hypothetical protein Celaphus_00019222 [Cervus elaphus hippelaphus]|uniref:Uncharacterized protein n=1 Tax=Cervus elaphus hippelaphus TaxID=46360 RepID=A0A212C3F2_CEREH|nr:hypothetical protein Celaphus_00019222 [Cervus elaphus hippelaphus]
MLTTRTPRVPGSKKNPRDGEQTGLTHFTTK